ncbi:MAG: squalene synthase HpnC [Chloroflexota bacterium]|nr:squalene synthase HpnC [Chloroflexota bacterium]MDE2919154.1 squalene synthase HpnC [Chloroflexota bacterium]
MTTTSPPKSVPSLAAVMQRAGGENFPVASRLLPGQLRRHLHNIYGFARLTDQLGDYAEGDRLALLDWLDGEVDAVYNGGLPSHDVMRRIVPTVARYSIPDAPFRALINANRQDQRVTRYATYEELAAYCALSANPVGQLVLYVFEAATPERFWLSDLICTALQLTEHWQDVAEDHAMDRVYLPLEDLDRFNCPVDAIAQRQPTSEFQALMQFEVDRAWGLFDRGATLVRTLPGVRGMAIAAFIEGGRAALQAIREADYDVLTQSPRPRARAKARAALRVMRVALDW